MHSAVRFIRRKALLGPEIRGSKAARYSSASPLWPCAVKSLAITPAPAKLVSQLPLASALHMPVLSSIMASADA